MERRQVVELYDEGYAAAYDQRFVHLPWAKAGVDFELSVIRDALRPGHRWLDVGCGTGYVLSRLPDVERAGLDISPAMLKQARAANPDIELHEGSFLDEWSVWEGSWDLLTCLWQPYHYVQSIWDVEKMVANMVRWTAQGGAILIAILDLEDVWPHTVVPYRHDPDVWGGTIAITGITWTWEEPGTGKVHRHSVAPHVEHFVELLAPDFETVEVLRYPPFMEGGVPRKAVLATGRRPAGSTGRARVLRPPPPEQAAAEQEPVGARRRPDA